MQSLLKDSLLRCSTSSYLGSAYVRNMLILLSKNGKRSLGNLQEMSEADKEW